LRLKLEYRNQIENEKMTPGILLTHGTITNTSLYHYHVAQRQFDTRQIFYFFKNIKKK